MININYTLNFESAKWMNDGAPYLKHWVEIYNDEDDSKIELDVEELEFILNSLKKKEADAKEK